MPAPLPPPAAVRNILTDLFDRRVTVIPGEPQTLDPAQRASAAVYREDDGTVAAVCLWELGLSVPVAAAMGGIPAAQASAAARGGELAGELPEHFHEVANVLTGLLNAGSAAHSVLDDVHPVPGTVPADVAALVRAPTARVDYEVTVHGFDPGTMTWLTAAPPAT